RWMWGVRQVAEATPWCLLIADGLYVIAATPLAGPLTFDPAQPNSLVIKHVLYGLIALFLLLPGFLGRWGDDSTWARILRSPVVVYLGTISYGVFLWHLVLLRFVQNALGLEIFGGGFWIVWTLVVIVTIAFASVSWFAIERPLQLWTHRRPSRGASAPAPLPT
ncbi:MAG: acyltransferase family protein, partial [Actinomycetota bacterium]